MNLKDLIETLESQEDLSKIVPIGFGSPHSYRGDYSELAFKTEEYVTIQYMLDQAKEALGNTYEGWKGGDFTMNEYTPCYIVPQEGCTGEEIGSVLLKYMLGSV